MLQTSMAKYLKTFELFYIYKIVHILGLFCPPPPKKAYLFSFFFPSSYKKKIAQKLEMHGVMEKIGHRGKKN